MVQGPALGMVPPTYRRFLNAAGISGFSGRASGLDGASAASPLRIRGWMGVTGSTFRRMLGRSSRSSSTTWLRRSSVVPLAALMRFFIICRGVRIS